ncbi:secretin N-terminal domain-containing protein [Oceanimonas smirnovii]|uniref:secretin N-terminal domain-containing protein n=1 Tax=Oceanimonas smirnovii TaxID=264574 RepID=UPI000373E11D|nr:secretin N-terminal domain-containing protein [Oceanimonas smirnovii]
MRKFSKKEYTPAYSKLALCVLSGLVLSGCVTQPDMTVKPVQATKMSDASSQVIVNETEGALSGQGGRFINPRSNVPAAPLLRQAESGTAERNNIALPEEKVSINADGMPLNYFINLALGDVLGLDYIVDESLANNEQLVTLRVTQPVSSDRMLGLIEEALQVNGVMLTVSDGLVTVIPSSKGEKGNISLLAETVGPKLKYGNVVEIIPIYYLPMIEASSMAERIVRESQGTVLIQNNLNALMVISRRDDIEKIHQLLTKLDVPKRVSSHMTVVQPSYLTQQELMEDLQRALKAAGVPVYEEEGNNGVVLVPMSNNILLISSSTRAWLDYTQDWVTRLDRPKPVGSGDGVYAYYMKNTKAADAWEVVSAIFGAQKEMGEGEQPGVDLLANANKEIERNNTNMVTPTYPLPGNRGGMRDNNNNARAQSMSVVTDEYRVVVDAKRNALIFTGRYSDYQRLVELLKFVDQRPRQVLLQAVIAEVSLQDSTSLGVSWDITDGDITGGTSALASSGFLNLTGVFSDVTARLNAALTNSQARILSTPRIIALDQESASINVGDQIAVKTGQIGGSDNNQEVATFQYISVGLTLDITPSINQNGLVELTISQEVSVPGTGGGGDTPPIQTRSLNTKLLADSGDTVYMGGLIRRNTTTTERKVPFFGDIPGLGYLFKSQEDDVNITELVLLITPYVINSREDAGFYTNEFRTITGWNPFEPQGQS